MAQLVAHLVWDQRVARSSRVTPTKKELGKRRALFDLGVTAAKPLHLLFLNLFDNEEGGKVALVEASQILGISIT